MCVFIFLQAIFQDPLRICLYCKQHVSMLRMFDVALALTGIIWSRYALVITPKNYNLFGVNCFVGSIGVYQLYRIWNYRNKANAIYLISVYLQKHQSERATIQ